jgi:hypothetical protein
VENGSVEQRTCALAGKTTPVPTVVGVA